MCRLWRLHRRGDVNDYRMPHTAPGPELGAPLHALTGAYPDDVYDRATQLRFYGTGDTAMDQEAFALANRVRDEPDAVVLVFRAVPGDVDEINAGDWVTPVYAYAVLNALQLTADERAHIVALEVPARELYTNGDSILEWGWQPTEGGPA